MEPIILKNRNEKGEILQATYLPERGMNLISYKLGNVEVIDQSTKEKFEQHSAGLGPLIGPHFHLRKPGVIPKIDTAKFPYTAEISPGHADPFSHGIGRYAPWKVQGSDTSIKATLSGKDLWKDVQLSVLEGQGFQMSYHANLTPKGLEIEYSVVSDTDSVVGLHYYYQLPKGNGTVVSQIQKTYIVANERKPLPEHWKIDEQQKLRYKLSSESEEVDFTFFPYPNPLEAEITLETETHDLLISYSSNSQENSWQFWHPKGASFACIEPISAQDPRHPNLSVSSIKVRLQIKKR